MRLGKAFRVGEGPSPGGRGRIYSHPGHFLRGGAPPHLGPQGGEGESGILDLRGGSSPLPPPPCPAMAYCQNSWLKRHSSERWDLYVCLKLCLKLCLKFECNPSCDIGLNFECCFQAAVLKHDVEIQEKLNRQYSLFHPVYSARFSVKIQRFS